MVTIKSHVPTHVIVLCKEKLIEKKAEILNRIRANYRDYSSRDRGGDETDLAVDSLAEDTFLSQQNHLQSTLIDIEVALAKIQNGSFGICEETEEPIELERLLALPWTRLSIEGAEMREDLLNRFAK